MKTNKYLKILLAALLSALFPLLSFVNSIANAQAGNSNNEIVKFIDNEINSLNQSKKVKGAVLSVVKDGTIVLSKGYGYADEKNNVKADPENSTFMIASVSKTFVALAAMQLVEAGKLDMNAEIRQYLDPDFPKFKYPVTMADLLTHSAGFEDKYSTAEIALEVEKKDEILPLNKFVRNFMPYQVFKPGEVSAYSNYGVTLAGYVIERISGISFYDYAENNIFKPLKMKNTTYKADPNGIPSKSYGPKGTEKNDIYSNSYPAGSVTSTANDMAAYMNFLMDEKKQSPLNNHGKEEMFKKQFAMSNELPGHGYVWERHEINGHVFYSHSGGSANFISTLAIYPEEKLGIFIACNQSGAFELADYYFAIAEKLYGKDREEKSYTGANSRDISGWYIPVRSVFKGSDKFVNIIMGLLTGYPKKITGNTAEGFSIGENKLTPVSEDAYLDKNMGYIKFVEKNGNLYYTPKQSYISFIRVPWIYGKEWQIFVILFFVVIGLFGFIIAIVRIIAAFAKKKGNGPIVTSLPLITTFLLLVSIPVRFIYHIDYMTYVFGDLNNTAGLPGVITFFKIAAALLLISGLCGLVSTIYIWLQKKMVFTKVFYSLWSIAAILLLSLLYQMNLIG